MDARRDIIMRAGCAEGDRPVVLAGLSHLRAHESPEHLAFHEIAPASVPIALCSQRGMHIHRQIP
jgi:hypothetical protein